MKGVQCFHYPSDSKLAPIEEAQRGSGIEESERTDNSARVSGAMTCSCKPQSNSRFKVLDDSVNSLYNQTAARHDMLRLIGDNVRLPTQPKVFIKSSGKL